MHSSLPSSHPPPPTPTSPSHCHHTPPPPLPSSSLMPRLLFQRARKMQSGNETTLHSSSLLTLGLFLWLLCGWVGKTPSEQTGLTIVWRCVWCGLARRGYEEEIDKSLWGELELEEEEEEVRGRVWKQPQVCVCTCVHTINQSILQLEDKHIPNLIYLPAQK